MKDDDYSWLEEILLTTPNKAGLKAHREDHAWAFFAGAGVVGVIISFTPVGIPLIIASVGALLFIKAWNALFYN